MSALTFGIYLQNFIFSISNTQDSLHYCQVTATGLQMFSFKETIKLQMCKIIMPLSNQVQHKLTFNTFQCLRNMRCHLTNILYEDSKNLFIIQAVSTVTYVHKTSNLFMPSLHKTYSIIFLNWLFKSKNFCKNLLFPTPSGRDFTGKS